MKTIDEKSFQLGEKVVMQLEPNPYNYEFTNLHGVIDSYDSGVYQVSIEDMGVYSFDPSDLISYSVWKKRNDFKQQLQEVLDE